MVSHEITSYVEFFIASLFVYYPLFISAEVHHHPTRIRTVRVISFVNMYYLNPILSPNLKIQILKIIQFSHIFSVGPLQ